MEDEIIQGVHDFDDLVYQCFIESVLTFGIVVWYSGFPMISKRKLTKLVNVASKVVGLQLAQLQDIQYMINGLWVSLNIF